MTQKNKGYRYLQLAFQRCKSGLYGIAAFSFLINLLMLAGPLYMMLVYDRVLASQSVPTLVGISVLIGGLLLAQGILTMIRSRMLIRVGNRLSQSMEEVVFHAHVEKSVQKGASSAQTLRQLKTLREFLGGSTLPVLFDAPWALIYIGVVYLLHPVLGLISLAGFVVLLLCGIANEFFTRGRLREAAEWSHESGKLLGDTMRNAEVVSAQGMTARLFKRWTKLESRAQYRQSKASDVSSDFGAMSRTVRLILQSMILGTGAYLAIQGQLSPGAIIAASIIMARGLAPAEQAITGWKQWLTARAAYRTLKLDLMEFMLEQPRMTLPKPKGSLIVRQAYIAAPNSTKPILNNVSFSLAAGDVLAIIGPSGSGKSALARSLVAAWPAMRGTIRLDGADLTQWSKNQLGDAIGYLPQDVELFDGTVRENIARFADEIDDREVVEAAKKAGAHGLILSLPNGYETRIGESGRHLSGGQRQRIGLARAMFGNPCLIVLDEPNSNLDSLGDVALHDAIRSWKEEGRTAIIVSHRPSAVELAHKVLALDNGRVRAFGPKDQILKTTDRGTMIASGIASGMSQSRTAAVAAE
ncbi:type I secretion system permease/ATPase [Coralliovum pocilloporae]|uniref:type I secretion system permease/ATPase n=1 Tax=Coralliovum pocilloporae TaxID=3066369 RepID=UPI0033078609